MYNDNDWIFPTVMALVVAGVFVLILYLSAQDEENRKFGREFKGACTISGGFVHGDLCTKDNKVLFSKDDYRKLAK